MQPEPDILAIARLALSNTRKALLSSTNTVLGDTGNIKTAADFLAQTTLLEVFKQHNFSCKFYSEELAEPVLLGDGRFTVSADPVDNSYLFVKGINAFCSIVMTILEEDELRYAFVQSLGDDNLYYCDAEHAYLNDQRLTVQEKEPVLIAAYAGRSDRFGYIEKLKQLPSEYFYLNTGGPLLSAMVASNHFSATIDFKPTGFYEMAGNIIAQKAGAFVETIDGKPIVFDPTVKQAIITANSEKLLREIQSVVR